MVKRFYFSNYSHDVLLERIRCAVPARPTSFPRPELRPRIGVRTAHLCEICRPICLARERNTPPGLVVFAHESDSGSNSLRATSEAPTSRTQKQACRSCRSDAAGRCRCVPGPARPAFALRQQSPSPIAEMATARLGARAVGPHRFLRYKRAARERRRGSHCCNKSQTPSRMID